MEEKSRFVIVLVTAPPEAGERLAASLVEERLAACVNRIPRIRSGYRWEGKVESDEEELLLIKTKREMFGAVEAHVIKNHPYDLPEVIALPLTAGSAGYLDWIADSVEKE